MNDRGLGLGWRSKVEKDEWMRPEKNERVTKGGMGYRKGEG